MSEEKLYIPYVELQDVSTGSTPGLYFVKSENGQTLRLQFEGGRLDEVSTLLKQTASEETQHTIELLEKKLNDEEVKGIEDEAPELSEDRGDRYCFKNQTFWIKSEAF